MSFYKHHRQRRFYKRMAMKIKTAIITLSDTRRLPSQDESGVVMRQYLEAAGYEVVSYDLIRDEYDDIVRVLTQRCDEDVDLLLTTGGTGVSLRDQTPEATQVVIEKEVPGISEALRAYSLTLTPHAMFSRAVAGIRGKTLLINLPGSKKAVEQSLTFLLPHLPHAVAVLQGQVNQCASTEDSHRQI